MSAGEPRYKTPEAARTAVTDLLRAQAKIGPWQLADLQRQYAYDQLVERLYRVDEGWVIKGATALLARRVSVRHTIDIDLYRAGAIADVERQLREAAALEIGDWMRFEVGPSVRVWAAGAQAARVKVKAFIGIKVWAAFQVDVVTGGIVMTGEPDMVPPLTSIEIVDRARKPWRAYPLVDHVADKVCAILERHDGYPSTRFKDLVDLVAITHHISVPAALQMQALTTEAKRRKLILPADFDVPDRDIWARGYRSEARRTIGLAEIELDDALTTVRSFLDQLLDGTATGSGTLSAVPGADGSAGRRIVCPPRVRRANCLWRRRRTRRARGRQHDEQISPGTPSSNPRYGRTSLHSTAVAVFLLTTETAT